MTDTKILIVALKEELELIAEDVNGFDRLKEYESENEGLPWAVSWDGLHELYHYRINHRFNGLLPLQKFTIKMETWQDMECFLERIVEKDSDLIVPGGFSLTRPVTICFGFRIELVVSYWTTTDRMKISAARDFEGFTKAPSWKNMGAKAVTYCKPFRVGDK